MEKRAYGDWIKWLKGNVPFSVGHAQRLIRVAEMFDDATLVSHLGLTSSKAYILTRVGKDDIGHFSTTLFYVGSGRKLVKDMTKRENVEEVEKSRNARLARSIIAALPKELDAKTHIAMVRQYVQEYFVQRGMCADVSIHSKGDGNPHAHILLTTRPLDCDGRWMDKQHRNYLLDENGERIFDPATGRYKLGRSIKTHDWDDSDRVQEWRTGWANTCNTQSRLHGIDKEVTCVSYAKQGIGREPTKHLGAKVRAMEDRGILTDRGNDNRRIMAERQRQNRQRFRQRMEQSRTRSMERDLEQER